jgi:cyanophycinase
MIRFVVWMLLLGLALSLKLFMFGGVLVNDDSPAYHQLALATGKPTRQGCDQNWDTTDCPRVAVITSGCPDSQCGEDEYNKGDGEEVGTEDFFLKLGMAPKHFPIQVDNYKDTTNIFSIEGYRYYFLSEQIDVVYFNGGDQSRHIRCWLNDDGQPNPIFSQIRRRILNNEAIVVGVSAGTAALTKTVYGGGSSFGMLYFSNSVGLASNTIASGNGVEDRRNGTNCLQNSENGAYLPGFGFADFLVDTHFDKRGRLGRLVPALVQLRMTLGVGIDEYACLYYEDGVGTVYGRNGVFIADTTEAVKGESQYFHLKNVKVHYLSSGDSFNFKTRRLTTAKKALAPTISGFSDSSDILSAYECTRLLTRLVDQAGLENLGRTRIPRDEAYPRSTPLFSLLFYKDTETKGFRRDTSYAVENVRLDVSAESRQ